MKKALIFLLILSISATSLIGCKTTKDPTETTGTGSAKPVDPGKIEQKSPEEVYADILANSDNLHLTVTADSDEAMFSMKYTQEMFICGDNIYSKTSTKMFGMSETEESYFEMTESGMWYYFTVDDVWYKSEFSDDIYYSLLDFEDEDFAAIFTSDCYGDYDSDTHRYTMTRFPEAEDPDMEGTVFKSGYLELGYGSYTLHVELEEDGSPTTTDITFSDFGKIEVTFPDALPYTGPEMPTPPESAPTPTEIAELISGSDSISIYRTLISDEELIVYEVVEREGKNYSVTRYSEDEDGSWILQETQDGYILYQGTDVYDKDGEYVETHWTKSAISEAELASYLPSYEELNLLLSADCFGEYDPESGLYRMKDETPVTIEGLGSVSGATIAVESSEYIGLTFTVTIPAAFGGKPCTLEYMITGMDSTLLIYPDMDGVGEAA